MSQAPEIHGKLLAVNTSWNLLGQAAPMLIGLATIPYVVRGLGTEEFGILSIAWVLLGYFSLFDLGLGRATTKFVADCLGKGSLDDLPVLVWTSLGAQILLGVVGMGLVMGATPLLVDKVLKIPPSLLGQTKITFLILAASLPVVLAGNSLRGVLEAAQRFDLVNYVRLPASSAVFLLPAIALPFGLRLRGIVLLLSLARVGGTLAYLAMCFRLFPILRQGFQFHRGKLRLLAVYGGWVTVSNVVAPLLIYMDRLLIGTLLPMSALTYYTAPGDMVTRFLFFPTSLVTALFPAFSSLDAIGDRRRLEGIFARSAKFLLLILGPMMLMIAVFARDILRLWLGGDFALKSTALLQILALGVLFNSLAFVPYTLLQGIERPDLTAKFHLLEIPLEIGLLWFLVTRFGITGAAWAWALRVVVDALLLFGACFWLRLISLHALRESGFIRSIVAVLVLALPLSLTMLANVTLLTQVVVAALTLSLFALGTWNMALDSGDRSFLSSAANRVTSLGRAK